MDSSDESYYMVTTTVKEMMYVSGQTYFDIKYEYEFHGDESSQKMIHPLYMKEDADGVTVDADGVIVIKNAMTKIMVDYLLMESTELQQVTGTSTAQHYRTQIMMNLNRLWD